MWKSIWKITRQYSENTQKILRKYLKTTQKFSENFSESFQHFWRVWRSIMYIRSRVLRSRDKTLAQSWKSNNDLMNSPSITRIRGSSHVISELSIAGRQGTNGEGKADSQSLYSSSKMQRHYLARPKTKLQFERTLIIYFVNYRRTYVCNK